MTDLRIIIPVHNEVAYTAGCLESLESVGVEDRQIVVVNNGSTDGTDKLLATRPNVRVIRNEQNRGCSVAWNQGVEASLDATWLLILNNDTVIPPGCLEGMIEFANSSGCDIVSPAKAEGDFDYKFLEFSDLFQNKMRNAIRRGWASGSGFMVHRRVFERIGLFDTKVGLAGNEDDDFFRRARHAKFRLAITGRAFLHHFGSVTQRSVKEALQMPRSAPLADRDYYRNKHKLGWWRRRMERFREKALFHMWRWNEMRRFGLTLKMLRLEGEWHFQ